MDNRKNYHKNYYQERRKDEKWVEEQRIACQKYKQLNYKKCKERAAAYKKTYPGKKAHKKSEWVKKTGLKETDERLNYIFDRWYFSTNCEMCGKEYKNDVDRCMDHHHSTGHFRCVCCNKCNSRLGKVDRLKSSVLLQLHRYFIMHS